MISLSQLSPPMAASFRLSTLPRLSTTGLLLGTCEKMGSLKTIKRLEVTSLVPAEVDIANSVEHLIAKITEDLSLKHCKSLVRRAGNKIQCGVLEEALYEQDRQTPDLHKARHLHERERKQHCSDCDDCY